MSRWRESIAKMVALHRGSTKVQDKDFLLADEIKYLMLFGLTHTASNARCKGIGR